MADTQEGNSVDVFGATTRGPGHRVAHAPNQDAWARGRVGPLSVAVVSDGLGSRPRAREGALAACRSALDGVRLWSRHPAAPLELLFGLIHLLWKARIAPANPEDCACTCLIAALLPNGSGVAAQLGDGLVLIRDRSGVTPLSERPAGDFANETAALGVTRTLAAWQSRVFESGPRTLVLCTDGVSEDLIPERLTEFVEWLLEEIRPQPPTRRWRTLQRLLDEWPTPRHTDDKTIAVVHAPGGEP